MKWKWFSWLFILSIQQFIACSSTPNFLDTTILYSSKITTVAYEVDYMEGASPYVGTTETGEQIWDFLKNNVSALFDGTKTVNVPTTLNEMRTIPAQNSNYSQEDISALAKKYRTIPTLDETEASIFIVYLDGYFEKDGTADSAVLGVSLGNQGIIGIFKKAIEKNTFASQKLRDFVEQSVLIHESGHSLGLVNNGITMTTAHQDLAHGAHCTNQNCVMYYLNEGVKDLLEFLGNGNPSTSSIVFGPECLDDAHAALHE